MAQRRFHYERAFEHYLRSARIPYVAVDEARKALVHDDLAPEIAAPMASPEAQSASLKSFDFVVYGPHANMLVELKGRKIRLRTASGAAATATGGESAAGAGDPAHVRTASATIGRRSGGLLAIAAAPDDGPNGASTSPARRAAALAARELNRRHRTTRRRTGAAAAATRSPLLRSAGREPDHDPFQQSFPFMPVQGSTAADVDDDLNRTDSLGLSRAEARQRTSRLTSLSPVLAPPPALRPPRTGRLESWATRGDVQCLLAWERLFGSAFRSVLVFVYWCEAQPPDTLFQDVFPFEDRWYSMRLIAADRYERAMVLRSPRWGTVHVPPSVYERISEPFTRAYQSGMGMERPTAERPDRAGGYSGRSARTRCELPLWESVDTVGWRGPNAAATDADVDAGGDDDDGLAVGPRPRGRLFNRRPANAGGLISRSEPRTGRDQTTGAGGSYHDGDASAAASGQ